MTCNCHGQDSLPKFQEWTFITNNSTNTEMVAYDHYDKYESCVYFLRTNGSTVRVATTSLYDTDGFKPQRLSDNDIERWLLAHDGDATAQIHLADMYRMGYGVPKKSQALAIKWYKLASDQGNIQAQYNLGVILENGWGIRKSPSGAAKLYEAAMSKGLKAAEKGDAVAQCTVAAMYENGRGVSKDIGEAIKWYRKAADQRYLGGLDAIDRLVMNGIISPPINQQESKANQNAVHGDNTPQNVTPLPQSSNSKPILTSTGTGFFISQDGYFLTCNHVVTKSKSITVMLGNKELPASIIKFDVSNDLALLRIQGKEFSAVSLRIDPPKKGAKVFTIGFPNPDLQGSESKYTDGSISSLSGIQGDVRTYQISVPVQPGNSGGALADENGNAVGIVVAKLNASIVFGYTGDIPENVNYAVKSIYALPLIQSVDGLSDRLMPQRNSLLPSNISTSVEKATCMVLVYK